LTRFTPQWLQSGSYAASQDRRLIGALWPGPASSGCAVSVAGGMTLNVAAGQVAVPTQNNTGGTLCTSDASEQIVIPAAPPSGQNRIDLVICHPRGADLDGGANNDWIWDSVQGTVAASPAVPATPAGTVAIYQVYVPGAAAALVAGNLTDVRPGGLGGPFKPSPASVYMSKPVTGFPVSTQTMFTGTLPSLPVPGTLIATLYGAGGFTASGQSGILPDLKRTDLNASILAYNNQTFNQPAGQMQAWAVPLPPLAIPPGSAIPVSCTVQLTGATTIYCGAYLLGSVFPS